MKELEEQQVREVSEMKAAEERKTDDMTVYAVSYA